MHAKPGLCVFFNIWIAGSGSVIAAFVRGTATHIYLICEFCSRDHACSSFSNLATTNGCTPPFQ